jgi:ubiquinone biosynthesis protein
MRLTKSLQAGRAIARVPQIVRVLVKYGFGDIVNRIGLDSFVHALKSKLFSDVEAQPFEGLRTEERIRLALEELGPTYVKMGQILATRPDLIPMSLIQELRKLQDKVAPFDTAGIKAHVSGELKRPLEEIFSSFDETPLAAASVAQVHRATLKDGRRVVLKIQRPNIERTIDTDLNIAEWLAELIEQRIPEVQRYNPSGIVKEFRKSIVKEIDFEREAYNMKRFARNFRQDPNVYVPKVYDEYTTSKILCEEFIDGVKAEAKLIMKDRSPAQREKIAQAGIRMIVEQIYVHGFFHADPHPGNIFILPDDRICPIDYGMMGVLDQERIDELLGFLVAILTKNTDKMIRLFFKLGLIREDVDVRALRLDLEDLLNRYEAVEMAKVDVGRFISQIFEVITRHDIVIPSDLMLMGKSLATIDGVARDIYPELDPLAALRPHVLKVYMRRIADPSYFSREPMRLAEELWFLAQTAPKDLRLFLRHLREGRAKVQLEVAGFEQAVKRHALATNRLALATIMTGIILGSCYLIGNAKDLERFVGNFPLQSLVGLAGLGVACFYGFVLFIGFLRSGGV